MKNILVPFLLSISFLPIASQATSYDEVHSVPLREIIPSNPLVISAGQVEEILRLTGLQMEELLVELLPIAKGFFFFFISGYQVGVSALGKSGNIYLGVNLEFPGLPLHETVHGEQFLVANARHHGETGILAIAVSAAPCGHCRQFLHEIDEEGKMQIIIPNALPRPLSHFLPEAFGPKDLGLEGNLLSGPHVASFLNQEDPLVMHAQRAANASYSPYTNSKSGVAVQMKDGKIFTGSYMENAAFNPSLSPLQSALVVLVSNLRRYEDITKVILVELRDVKSSQEAQTRALLKQIAPGAKFEVENALN
ncbi:MAG: cytidine deaminase [Chlamydiae bacterium]|nr:cytidine deaminase [Chlamydiota bacterium]